MVRTLHRRFRFGLRTLFVVVTVVACWCAYQVNWIRQRRAAVIEGSIPLGMFETRGWSIVSRDKAPAPGVLQLFGERGYDIIIWTQGLTPEEEVRLRYLFPEASVWKDWKPRARH